MAPRRSAAGLAAAQMVQLIAAGGLRVLYGDRIRSRGLDVFGQVPCMAGESSSMSGRQMLRIRAAGILIARWHVRGSLSPT
jgi:hypothetical protein